MAKRGGRGVVKVTMVALLSALVLTACSGVRPDHLGVDDGRLAPCPASPNCVSTFAHDDHRIEPLVVAGDAAQAWQSLRAAVAQLPRARIVQQSDHYLYVEVTSRVWRFVDDVEFYLLPEAKQIHMRSASRVGYGDFGVNRDRLEQVRQYYRSMQR